MQVKGWVKSSLLDYPGRVATSLFCGGCNFRCPHCHNRDLVLHPHCIPDIPHTEIQSFLHKRRGLLDGVVLSGGEPTLQPGLLPFARQVKELGFLVKLDTNGSRPDVLQELVDLGVVDYIAMDVKAPLSGYRLATGVQVDAALLQSSVDLVLRGRVEYEFRTTVVPGLLDEADLVAIARWVSGAQRYFLQQFVPRNTLDPQMLQCTPYPPDRLSSMAEAVRPYVRHVQVRGV